MDIKVPDNWLKEFLDTKASPEKIMESLSLCGPSVERITNKVYEIEITTNRIDCAGVYGIAREASAILPRFGIDAKLKNSKTPKLKTNYKLKSKVKYLDVKVDSKLCPRFTAVLIKNVKIGQSPKDIKDKLLAVGVNPINNVVDISNYVMHELGQPVHTFDYDKIANHKMVLRSSRPNERLTTLDGLQFKLNGGDIVIEDLPAQAGGSARLIDLCGIMGGMNSAINDNTKNVLLFVQTYDPVLIRKTSMSLAKRSEASQIFEKGIDPELVTAGMTRCIELFKKLTGGVVEKEILDIYPNPYIPKTLSVDIEIINKKIGIKINQKDIISYLSPLGFSSKIKNNKLEVIIPSWRSRDIEIPEDIVEEIARIYGYHNLPNTLMDGLIPPPLPDSPFDFEYKIKQILKSFRGVEVYTLSLVENDDNAKAYKLKNPLTDDAKYLRTSLFNSLITAAKENPSFSKFNLFEMANIYIPKNNDLPAETMTLAGVFKGYEYRKAKGIVESLLDNLNIKYEFKLTDLKNYKPSCGVEIYSGKTKLGELGLTQEQFIYYEFDVLTLKSLSQDYRKYTAIPKYPPQIEDLTIVFPERTKIGEVLKEINSINQLINKSELIDIFENAYTFNIEYQDPNKTLTDTEVEKIRNQILKVIKDKFGGSLK